MASFELKILTEDPAELKGLVDKLCSVRVEVRNEIRGSEVEVVVKPRAELPAGLKTHEESKAVMAEVKEAHHMTDEQVADVVDAAYAPVADRDAEGLKRDARIHSDAAEPFKTDGTWKRKRNTPDDTYDEVYEELAREAHAAGLYKGPLLGQFELEARVVDTGGPYYWAHDESGCVGICQTLKELSDMQDSDPCVENIGKEQYEARVSAGAAGDHKAPVVETLAPAPAPVAPAPQAAPAPVAPTPAGLSAQVSSSEERCKSLLTSMVKKVGPAVAVAALRMYGATAVTMLTPEQRESFCDVAEALLGDADATSANGSDKLAEIAVLLGVAV